MSSKRRLRRKSCIGKVRYDEATAKAVCKQNWRKVQLRAYKCNFCDAFHIGHLRSAKPLKVTQ